MRGTCSLTGGMLLVLILAVSMFHGTGLVGADDPSYVKVQYVGIAAAMVAGILAYLARGRLARTAQFLEQRRRD